MNDVLVISLKPEFANKILSGSKKIELRKCSPRLNNGSLVIIYATAPIKSVVGYCILQEVISASPNEVWNSYKEDLGIDKNRYFEYYQGYSKAVGLKVNQVKTLRESIPLSKIREQWPRFSPPQSFLYIPKLELMKSYLSGAFA